VLFTDFFLGQASGWKKRPNVGAKEVASKKESRVVGNDITHGRGYEGWHFAWRKKADMSDGFLTN
jgi:hypothetical protein